MTPPETPGLTALELVSDVLLLAGACSMVWGAWQAYPPGAYMLGGAFGVTAGFLIGRARA